MQRSFLITMLHELAALNAEHGPTLLLGFEEPELYQHPPQAQHISSVLEQLAASKEGNTQVIVSTHSPYFVSSKGFENMRVVRKHYVDKCSLVASTTYAKVEHAIAAALGEKADMPSVTMARIEQIMQPSQNELYFTKAAVLVEGPEDVAFIGAHLVLNGLWTEFRRLGCHFVVTNGKTNLSRPLAIANELCLRAFAVIDADSDDDEPEKQKRDNRCILRLCGQPEANVLPQSTLMFDNCVLWAPRIDSVVRNEAGALWQEAENRARKQKGFVHGVNRKNKLFITAIMEELNNRGFNSLSLQELCHRILAFADRPSTELTYVVEGRVGSDVPEEIAV
jgi:predicted ATP-dependent endonuclease of OLD family